MVVWWTKYQLGQKTTHHTPKHTPLDSCEVRMRATCGTCISRQHAYAHSPRLARLKGAMVVWWTKYQLGQKTTHHTPKHTPLDSCEVRMRAACGTCISRQHAYAHSPRLARLKGAMVVWWTKYHPRQHSTHHTPKHTPLDSCVVSLRATWHVHISPACIRPL